MQEKEIIEAFLKTDTGQRTAKKINNLVKENEHLKKEKISMQVRIKELEERLNESNISSFTKDDEILAREFMKEIENNVTSAYRGNRVNRYLFSIADDNDNEVRIYSNQLPAMMKGE